MCTILLNNGYTEDINPPYKSVASAVLLAELIFGERWFALVFSGEVVKRHILLGTKCDPQLCGLADGWPERIVCMARVFLCDGESGPCRTESGNIVDSPESAVFWAERKHGEQWLAVQFEGRMITRRALLGDSDRPWYVLFNRKVRRLAPWIHSLVAAENDATRVCPNWECVFR